MTYALRAVINLNTKIELAKYAASLIKDDQIVFIDSGSTLVHIVDHIKSHNNVFVTSGIETATKAAEHGLRIYLLPGFVNSQANYVYSNDGVNLLKTMNFDVAFVGVSGISRFYKYATNSPETASVKTMSIHQSEKTYVVSDASKFSVLGFVSFADFDQVTLITDQRPPNDLPNIDYIIPESLKIL